MVVEIRSLNIGDLEEVMDIEPVAFGSHHWSHQSFVNELSNSMGNYFAAYDRAANQLLGYSGFWLIGKRRISLHSLCIPIIGGATLVRDCL